jgi:transposase
MERDPKSKRNGYSSRSYRTVLEENLPQIYEPGMVYLQDNAPIHTAHIIRDWFVEEGIEILKLPPFSPDLNLIENT